MAFQTQSYQKQALGSAGQVSKSFHSFCNTVTGVVADANVCVGCFVQSIKTDATDENEVIGASGAAISGKILGVVVKDHYISSSNTSAVHIYNLGDNVEILNAGSIFIKTESAAKKGQYVFLKTADGSLVFDDKMVKADHTYTGFIVSKGQAEASEGIIEITTAQAYTVDTVVTITQ
ncbi:hypothetical protein ACMF0F_001373 [Campylobacter jejuni]